MPTDPNRIRDVFLAALELSPEQRPGLLAEACGGDADLRAEVDRLLVANADPDSILEPASPTPADATGAVVPGHLATVDRSGTASATDASDPGAPSPTEQATATVGPHGATGTFAQLDPDATLARESTESLARPDPYATTAVASAVPTPRTARVPTGEAIGTVIAGRYTLVDVIGEGGMGSVYLASQTEPVKRQVALKLIKTGMDSKAVLARFDAERQALALMDHPNIARIYDGGVTPAGQPFFVMELVRGVPLTAYCDTQRLSVKDRLELFVAVCQAVQHAHQKGIIHRDLKPGNVLVTEVDGRPTPKVIDFGVAKATEMKLTDMSLADTGAIVGTPAYMSPEQADPSSMDIDTRTDVYALGVILYELLTGSPPIDARQFKRGAILEMLRMVREVEPPRPSTKLGTAEALPNIAANRSVEPARLANLLRGELDWVVMKALEKDRTRRYETASGFARDIQRYLADEIVEARPPSAGYRLKKFVRRNPLQLALAATIALLVLGGGAVVWWQGVQAGARRESELRRQLEDDRRSAADNARLGRNAEAVAALLDQCEEALRAGDAAKAAVALDAARKRSAEGGAAEQANRLARLEADLALSRDLDAVDQFRWTPVENKLPGAAAVATRTRQVLARFGADPDLASVDEAAARVAASRVRERIVSALDRLLLFADVAALVPKRAGVRAVLRRVDADRYRDAVRDAILAEDRAKIGELAGQKAALEQPPGFVAFLGESPAIVVERRRQLLQSAVSRRSGDLGLLMTLGRTYPFNTTKGVDERLRWFQAAVAAAPANTSAHSNLGNALREKGQWDEAIACYRKAIELDPKFALAHNNLGNALSGKGQWDEAIACYRKAIELGPKLAAAHNNLGLTLSDKGQWDEAIACYRKAIELDPKYASAHTNLGIALGQKGQWDEAIACLKKAIELDPKFAMAHYNLGIALQLKGQLDEAIACLKKAIELDPKLAAFAGTQLAKAERMAAVRDQLAAYQNGSYTPASNAERLALAQWCEIKKLPLVAIDLYAAAFAADPKLADDLKAGHRYNAACDATLAAGQGNDAAKLDDKERTRLRQQARDWLRADLALWTKQLETGKTADRTTVQRMLSHWHKDPDLAGIRDAAALANLPGEEPKACTQLWADVAAVLKTANGPPSLASLREQLPQARKALPKDSPQLAGLLAQIGLGLLEQKKWTEAEPLIRECLAIREKTQADAWSTFNAKSLLGGALLGQKKYAEAEPLLMSGYEGMKRREKAIPEEGKARLPEALGRLVQLYEAMDRKDEAAKCREELDTIKAARKKPEKQP